MKAGLYNIKVPALDGKESYNENLTFVNEPTLEDINCLLKKFRPSRNYSQMIATIELVDYIDNET